MYFHYLDEVHQITSNARAFEINARWGRGLAFFLFLPNLCKRTVQKYRAMIVYYKASWELESTRTTQTNSTWGWRAVKTSLNSRNDSRRTGAGMILQQKKRCGLARYFPLSLYSERINGRWVPGSAWPVIVQVTTLLNKVVFCQSVIHRTWCLLEQTPKGKGWIKGSLLILLHLHKLAPTHLAHTEAFLTKPACETVEVKLLSW